MLPPVIRAEGRHWRVRRVWPTGRRGVPVEVTALPGHGSADAAAPGRAGVRAGWWRPDGIDLFAAGTDRHLPALATVEGVVVSHRPGKRAVVRTGDGRHVKVVRPGRTAGILAGIAHASPLAMTFRMPAVLADDDQTVTFATLSGHCLHDVGGADSPLTDRQWARAWRQVLAAHTAAGAAAHPSSRSTLPVHDAAAEVAVLHRWAGTWTGPRAPTWAPRLHHEVDRVTDDLLAGRPGPRRVIHRDLHDKQVVWDPVAGPGLLDVDTACLGEGALDLGNLRAHARWRRLQGVWTPRRVAAVLSEIDRVTAAADTTARTAVHERAALLRIACVHAFRPADRSLVAALVSEAAHQSQ